MNTQTKIALASLLTLPLMAIFSSSVSADVSQTQNLSQSYTVNCTTGAYGQNSTCTATGNQNGEQTQNVTSNNVLGTTPIVYRNNGTPVYKHKIVNTGVDPQVIVAGVATMITTAGGAIVTLKKRLV